MTEACAEAWQGCWEKEGRVCQRASRDVSQRALWELRQHASHDAQEKRPERESSQQPCHWCAIFALRLTCFATATQTSASHTHRLLRTIPRTVGTRSMSSGQFALQRSRLIAGLFGAKRIDIIELPNLTTTLISRAGIMPHSHAHRVAPRARQRCCPAAAHAPRWRRSEARSRHPAGPQHVQRCWAGGAQRLLARSAAARLPTATPGPCCTTNADGCVRRLTHRRWASSMPAAHYRGWRGTRSRSTA